MKNAFWTSWFCKFISSVANPTKFPGFFQLTNLYSYMQCLVYRAGSRGGLNRSFLSQQSSTLLVNGANSWGKSSPDRWIWWRRFWSWNSTVLNSGETWPSDVEELNGGKSSRSVLEISSESNQQRLRYCKWQNPHFWDIGNNFFFFLKRLQKDKTQHPRTVWDNGEWMI